MGDSKTAQFYNMALTWKQRESKRVDFFDRRLSHYLACCSTVAAGESRAMNVEVQSPDFDLEVSIRASGRAIPIAGDGEVAAVTQHEDNIGEAGGVRVAQIEKSVAIDADSVYAVGVPITGHRLVTGVPEHE